MAFINYLIYDLNAFVNYIYYSSIYFEMKLGRTGYLIGRVLMMRLGPVFLVAVLQIPPAMMRH